MPLSNLLPFQEALNALKVRVTFPTSLDTAGLRQIDSAIRRRSNFSAENMITDVLDAFQQKVESIVNPVSVKREDRITEENPEGFVTEGLDEATARLQLKEAYDAAGYSPAPGERGSIKDLASDYRINLKLRTDTEMMQGIGNFIQGQTVLEAFPAQELVRFEQTKKQRDWRSRWLQAAAYSGDTDAARVLKEFGRMVARKDSPIWDALGSSELFDDGLDNPYPPFAFNSGMWVQDVDFDTAEKMGLVTLNNVPEPQKLDIESLFKNAA